ncbi:T9SS type A sorting domain-containing protein [Flavobacterium nackdongense]|uniref:T9SS type A sorting domain-containing protein n=1 Tax=Flavobacterium nackdongense TaxID=2547394 RepID=A0A4P6YD94_9FLAO|nr:T9SS type A sorting domain-containing protein [Flavobacterium nackdongense]QBN18637.1 T9SS type A sorting domain-containing protein [Flavobacterium nackdongense]
MRRIFTLLLVLFLNTVTKAQWTKCNNPAGALPYSLTIQNDTLYLGTLSNGIYRSTDGGFNWTQINNGITSMQIWNIAYVNGVLYASSTNGTVFKSLNGGDNWVLSNTGISSTTIIRNFAFFNNKIFATSTNKGVYISSDNGSSWAQHNSGIVGLVAEPLLIVDTDLFVGVNQKVYKYDSVNQNWISKSTGIPNNTVGSLAYIKDNLQNISLFEATVNTNDVTISTNKGDSWTVAKSGLPSVGVYSLLGIGTEVYLGNDYGVYKTTNQGVSWVDVSGFTNASPAKFLCKSSTDLYVIQEAKLWKKSLASLSVSDQVISVQNVNFKIYPNPSYGNFNIEVTENLIGAKATIYNLLGQKVKEFELKSMTTNQNLNQGIYLLEIEKEGNKTTKKLLVN